MQGRGPHFDVSLYSQASSQAPREILQCRVLSRALAIVILRGLHASHNGQSLMLALPPGSQESLKTP
jgi:hypothetical protein